MSEHCPHPEALENFERAYISENKIRNYAFRNPHKSRLFAALGFSEEAGNWETLRDAILESLPSYPATLNKVDRWGTTHEVRVHITGPNGKEAPLKTYWIYEEGKNFPRLTSLYISAREWRQWEQERENAPEI